MRKEHFLGSVCVAVLLLPAALSSQKITTGPEIIAVKNNGAQLQVQVGLDMAAVAEIRHWKEGETAEGNRYRNTSLDRHNFDIPADANRKYVVVLLDANGQELTKSAIQTTSAYWAITQSVARANIENIQVGSGDQLQITVDVVNVPSMTVSWVPPAGRGTKSETVTLRNGRETYAVDLAHPAGVPTSVVAVEVVASNGAKATKSVITNPDPVVASLQIGGVAVIPGTRDVRFNIPVTTSAVPIYYELVLRDSLSFERKWTGSCPNPSSCVIEATGLTPATGYTYQLDVGPTATGPFTRYVAAAGTKFTTISLPRILEGPRIIFTANGLNVLVKTDRAVDSELTYRLAPDGGGTGTQQITDRRSGTEHLYEINRTLVFARSNETVRADLSFNMRETGTDRLLQSIPIAIGGEFAGITNTSSQKNQIKNQQVKNIVDEYGPAVMSLLGLIF